MIELFREDTNQGIGAANRGIGVYSITQCGGLLLLGLSAGGRRLRGAGWVSPPKRSWMENNVLDEEVMP